MNRTQFFNFFHGIRVALPGLASVSLELPFFFELLLQVPILQNKPTNQVGIQNFFTMPKDKNTRNSSMEEAINSPQNQTPTLSNQIDSTQEDRSFV